MKSKFFVDIILPTYNSREFIHNSIISVFNQTYRYWRLIIIDDGSTDGTKEYLYKMYKKFKNKRKIIILRNKTNKGQAFSRNLGLKKISNKFVAFLDSDDSWPKNKLKHQIKFMIKNNYDFTYTNYKTVMNNKVKKVVVPDSYNYNQFVRNTSIGLSTIILKRKIIENLYFKNLKFLEDYFFKCQVLKKINYAYKCSNTYAYYQIRNNSLQSNRFGVIYFLWKINRNLNKMNFYENMLSLLYISFNSLKKYGFR
jgi:teichuronic acid biosynthesis glycosyltransferase TuaG